MEVKGKGKGKGRINAAVVVAYATSNAFVSATRPGQLGWRTCKYVACNNKVIGQFRRCVAGRVL